SIIRRVILHVHGSFQSERDFFGICRQYLHCPSFEPDSFVSSTLLAKGVHVVPRPHLPPPPYPFANMTIYHLMQWMNMGSKHKSEGKVTRLIQAMLLAEDFNSVDLHGFSSNRHLQLLNEDHAPGESSGNSEVVFPDNWKVSSVDIKVPTRTKTNQGSSQKYSVLGFHYRSLVEVICSVFNDIQAKTFHLWPFEQIWHDPITGKVQQAFGELYTLDSWTNAHAVLQKQALEPGCKLERVIPGLMFFSDATHLATFGNAKAWPLYLYFGNISKYAHAMPNSGACHLVAFFPS
ncbi:hypothetical protein M404DRAFT_70977, partial [Pisolithus tinctorius Marx 270]